MGDFTEAVEKMLAQAKEAERLRESLETAEERIEELEAEVAKLEDAVDRAADEAREEAEKEAAKEAEAVAERTAFEIRDAVRVFREAAPRLAWGAVHKKLLKVAPSHADILQALCARLGWGADNSPDSADIAEAAELGRRNEEIQKENRELRSALGQIRDLVVGKETRGIIKALEVVHAEIYTLSSNANTASPAPVAPVAPEPAKKPRKRKARAEQPAPTTAPEPPAVEPLPEPAASPLAVPTSPRLKSFAALPVAPAGASADGEEPPKKRTNFEELFLKLAAKSPSKGQQQRAALREQEREEDALPTKPVEAPAPKPAVVAAAEAVIAAAEAIADDPEGGPDQPGRLALADLRRYIDANDGRCGALVTVVAGSAEGARRTFRFRAKAKAKLAANERKAYFLDVLSGPDNGVDYSGCGSLVKLANGGCEYRPYGEVSATTRAAATLLAGGLNTQAGAAPLPAGVEFWHQGTCARCGRSLTVPESIASGLGPECLAAVGG